MNEQTHTEQGRTFERRVGNLFALLGYQVYYDRLVGGRQVDLIIEERSGPLSRAYIVECKNQVKPVSTAQYDAFHGRLAAAKRELGAKTQGIMVASVAFVKEATAQSAHEEIQLVTFSELEKTLIDFRQYIADLVKTLQDDSTLRFFVQPNVRGENLSLPDSAEDYFWRWLADPVSNQMTLLGDYGTGKTTLLKYLALKMADAYVKRAIEAGGYSRVPIFIDLREHARAISLKQFILDFLDSNSIRVSSYAAFEYMLREGHIVLIVDGFDEMASRGDPHATLRNFREINHVATGRAKVVLSCRTHYFTTQAELQRHHGLAPGMHLRGRTYTDLYREIAAKPNFVILHLLDFDVEQVREYIGRRCGDYAERVAAFIETTYNLPELSRRPVLLDMIVASHGTLGGRTQPVSPSDLYAVYTDIWLTRNDWCNALDVPTKCALLEMFAKRVSETPEGQLHFREIPPLIREWRNELSDVHAEEVDRELRIASFLVRDTKGNYRFSHKSFFEYFYARFLLGDVQLHDGKSWEGRYFATEVYRFLREMLPSQESTIRLLLPWITDSSRDQYARTNAIKVLSVIDHADVENALVKALSNDAVDRVRWSAATALSNYEGESTVDQLIQAFRSDASKYVRSNSLASLARINTPRSIAFLHAFLDSEGETVLAKGSIRAHFFHGLRGCRDTDVLRRAIEKAPLYSARRVTLPAVLDLCRRLKTEACLSYCERLLEVTRSPVLTASAFLLLPPSRRERFLGKVFEQVRRYSGKPFVAPLIRAVSGLKRDDVKEFLISTVDRAKPDEAIAAVSILREDYALQIEENVRIWMLTRESSYQIRVAAAHVYAELVGERVGEPLMELLRARERIVIKRTALDLIRRHCPNKVESAVKRIWEAGVVPGLAQYSIETLMRIAPESAFALVRERGLRATQPGVRVAVCAALSELRTREVTEALIEVMQNDNSKWVRLQALRSLCVPGRTVAKRDIMAATRNEQSRLVLRVRSELLSE